MDTTTGAHGTYDDELVIRYYVAVSDRLVDARHAILNHRDGISDELLEWVEAIDPADLDATPPDPNAFAQAIASNPSVPPYVLDQLAASTPGTRRVEVTRPTGLDISVGSLRWRPIVAELAAVLADHDSDTAQTVTALLRSGFDGTVAELLDAAAGVLHAAA